ncbi:type II secretion protein E [Serratia marcescens]|uniref:GspE/PulE family protein n=1 Tax=Serratia marcescens TaxID=615 RepID=UPI00062C8A5D|nr:ATPase, T2SS/T4P/T4SS family [Serratia marcescens]KKZ15840.1 type II secretion protein E [Serratia marcescens]
MKIDTRAAPYLHWEASPEGPPTLWVSADHRTEPAVQSAMNHCFKHHRTAVLRPVPLDELRERQQQQAAQTPADAGDVSAQQAKVIDYFREAAKRRASDIHFLIGLEGLTKVQMRIHGDLETLSPLEMDVGMSLASTIVLSMCDVTEKSFNPKRQQDGRVRRDFLQGLGLFGARYAHTPTEFGLYVVMRILPDDGDNVPDLTALGFLPAQQGLINRMLVTPEGVIIMSGPTGSGKSTSLRTFSQIYLVHTGGRKRLLTIEDPPEGRIAGAVQTPIIADKNDPEAVTHAWVRAISASLRLDPDAIIVGEIRETNSAKSALSASRSGHLVLATLHANSSIGILDRLTDSFDIRPGEVADPQMMIGLLSQRLVQVLCPHCKIPWAQKKDLTGEQLALLTRFCDTERLAFRNRKGCDHCHKGVVGRKVIAEVIRPDATFMNLLRHEGKMAARSYWVHTLGGITRGMHLQHYLRDGLVDPLDADAISPLDEDSLTLLPTPEKEEPAHEPA